ncbi:MAG: hypothetical protein ACOYK8_03730 [Alphaproteobacteria bacterium]
MKMKAGKAFLMMAIITPLLLAAYYVVSIPLQVPIPAQLSLYDIDVFTVEVKEGGTNYVPPSVLGLLIGGGFLAALHACSNVNIKIKKERRSLIILSAITFMAVMFQLSSLAH